MSIHNPAHPGEIIKELLIEPLELTITDVSKRDLSITNVF